MILPLEQQVVSLESAKRLKELGFPQESLFCWIYGVLLPHTDFQCQNKDQEFIYSSYTVAELGEILPGFIIKNDRRYFQSFRKNVHHEREGIIKYSHGFSYTAYWDRCYEDMMYAVCEKNEAESRAEMLIHLAENGLMEVKKT